MLPKKNTSVATLALIFSLAAVPHAIAGSPLSLGSTLTQPATASTLVVAPSDQSEGINPALKQRFDNPSAQTPVPSFASDSTDATQSQLSPNLPRTVQSGLWDGLWGFLPILAILGLGWGWYRSRQSQPKTAEDSNLSNNSKLGDRNPTQSLAEDGSQQPRNTDQKLPGEITESPASDIDHQPEDHQLEAAVSSTETLKTGVTPLKTSEISISRQQSSDQPAGEIARDFTSSTKVDSEPIQITPSADDNQADMTTIKPPEFSETPSQPKSQTETESPELLETEGTLEGATDQRADQSDQAGTFPQDAVKSEVTASQTAEPPQESNLKADQAKSDTNFNTHTPSDIEAAKFNLGQTAPVEPELASVDEGLPELPDGYGKTKIVLMPREPNSAYAYWDIPNEDKEKLRQQGGEQLALRFYDVTGIDMDQQKPHSVQQFDCEEMTREWYIEVPMSDHDYIVEIGYVTEKGRWLVLARSLHVRIPPVYPCDWYGDDFRTVNWEDNLRHSS